MLTHGGLWQCAFFDREPHALFGEDVKTRNAIVFRRETVVDPPRGKPANIETGPLRKWRSTTRDRLFTSIAFTALERPAIAAGLPKLDGGEQAHAYAALWKRADTLRTIYTRARKC